MQGRLGGLLIVGSALGIIVVGTAITPKHESVVKNNGVILAEKKEFVKSIGQSLENLPFEVLEVSDGY